MSSLRDFVLSGRIADVAAVVMALEAVVLLFVLRPLSAKRWMGVAGNLLAGASLVVAVRLALTDAGWQWIAVAFTCSLVGHVADLWARLASR